MCTLPWFYADCILLFSFSASITVVTLVKFVINLLFNTEKMPPPDVMYCSQQINIPPELPDLLKQFTKAAIRTQPQDVLAWSSA